MELLLTRTTLTPDETHGTLSIDGVPVCCTLEDPVRPPGIKLLHETAIPAGRYPVTITKSQRFGVMLPLIDVGQGGQGWTGVRIHSGNTTADTSGCILVGLSHTDHTILSSRLALAKVQGALAQALSKSQPCWITLVNPHPKEPHVMV